MLIRSRGSKAEASRNKDKNHRLPAQGCNQSSMKNVACKHCFEQSDRDEKHSNNDVMTESQKRTVNKYRQRMTNIWSQRTKNQWRYGQNWRSHEKM